jgi:hypothetical protein
MRHKVAVCAVIIAATLTACDQQKPAPKPVIPPPSPEQMAKAKYEMDEKCGADARAWFKANYSEPSVLIEDQLGVGAAPPTYRNHYSQKFKGCFALLEFLSIFPGQTLQTSELWDVNENRKVGGIVQKLFEAAHNLTSCDVEESQCASKAEFEGMIRGYLVE